MSLSRRGCKQPFHRLFGRLVLLENPRIVLRADSQPVRIPFHQRQNKTNRQKFACSFCLAEAKGFAPRHCFSSLVTARLLLYFSHFYYFFVAITRKEIHLHSKDEIGIQPFPASGSPSAGFSLSLKCERRQ